jgi:hypothetical protein
MVVRVYGTFRVYGMLLNMAFRVYSMFALITHDRRLR